MIKSEQLVEIGKFNSPHGINGEISVSLNYDVNVAELRCIVVNIDGIFVPFFVEQIRPRNHSSLLLTIEGISNEQQAGELKNKPIFALSDEIDIEPEDPDDDGLYAADLIGFHTKDTENRLDGEITDIDDTTENVLFVVTTADGKSLLIPIADEYIAEIDREHREIIFELPEGFLEI